MRNSLTPAAEQLTGTMPAISIGTGVMWPLCSVVTIRWCDADQVID